MQLNFLKGDEITLRTNKCHLSKDIYSTSWEGKKR